MTLANVPMPTPVEELLADLLDREWEAQSARAAPLQPTVPVRTLLELVLARAPMGIFTANRVAGATPAEVVANVRDDLPGELSPWTRRSLHRARALRFPTHALPPGEEAHALPPASGPVALASADVPRLPAPKQRPGPEPAAVPARRRSRLGAVGLALLVGLVGAGIAAFGAAVNVGAWVLGAAAALAAAVLTLALGGRR